MTIHRKKEILKENVKIALDIAEYAHKLAITPDYNLSGEGHVALYTVVVQESLRFLLGGKK